MNKSQRNEIAGLVDTVSEILEELKRLLADYHNPQNARHDVPQNLKIGMKVQAYAMCADMGGICLNGEMAVVVELPSPNGFSRAVTVQIVDGPLKGSLFKVYPQQCLILDRGKSAKKAGEII